MSNAKPLAIPKQIGLTKGMSTPPVTPAHTWDVRNGMVYRDGRGVVAFHDYHLAHPDGMTVEQWEASKRRQCHRLMFGSWPTADETWCEPCQNLHGPATPATPCHPDYDPTDAELATAGLIVGRS